jgi:hypothetical protein
MTSALKAQEAIDLNILAVPNSSKATFF